MTTSMTTRKRNWEWLLAKLEAQTSHWCNRWLSIGGRLTLVESVLEAIPVFWHSLAFLPKGVLEAVKGCQEIIL